MGLRFSYIIVIEANREAELKVLVNASNEAQSSEGDCLQMTFSLDKELGDYLKEIVRYDTSTRFWRKFFIRKSDYPYYFPTDQTGQIGCVYFKTYQLRNKSYLLATFTAATNRMSGLFVSSQSLKNYFAGLASKLQAECCFIDLEDEGYIPILGGNTLAYGFKKLFDELIDQGAD